MEVQKKKEFAWENIEPNICSNPTEALVYYLYKLQLDTKNKKNNLIKNDKISIKEYLNLIDKIGGKI